jgi:hypothetical protein
MAARKHAALLCRGLISACPSRALILAAGLLASLIDSGTSAQEYPTTVTVEVYLLTLDPDLPEERLDCLAMFRHGQLLANDEDSELAVVG